VLVDAPRLFQALRLPADSTVESEPLAHTPTIVERVTVRPPAAEPMVVLLRDHEDIERSQNHLAIMEALTAAAFPFAPTLLAIVGTVAIERWVEGATALALVPPPGACEAAIDAIAALHALPVREGLHWEAQPADLYPDEELPLHRLGFASHEREPARRPLAEARRALLASPFGFTHGDCTAANVVLRPHAATLTEFGAAGFGPQMFDVAAFLLTAGLEPEARRSLAERYTTRRDIQPGTPDLIDLLGILWGITELLRLPHRLIAALGDDPSVDAWKTAAGRIERGLRTPAGDHPTANAIRAALWPS
jgi:hypothetical protein